MPSPARFSSLSRAAQMHFPSLSSAAQYTLHRCPRAAQLIFRRCPTHPEQFVLFLLWSVRANTWSCTVVNCRLHASTGGGFRQRVVRLSHPTILRVGLNLQYSLMLMGPELPQLLFIHIIVSINNYGHRSTPVIIGQHIWPTHPSIGQHLRPSTKSFGHRGISSVIGWRRPTRTPPVCICLDRHYFILLFIHLNGGECETNITSINNTSKLDGGYYLLDPGVWSLPRISGKYGERTARPNNIIHNIYIIYTPPSISLSQVMGYTHSQHAPLQQLSVFFLYITMHIWMRIPLIETFTKPNANKRK